MTISTTEALNKAMGRVRITGLGPKGQRQFQVDHYLGNHNIWQLGNVIYNKRDALAQAWELKLKIALELLDIENAALIAAQESMKAQKAIIWPDFRTVVRHIVRDLKEKTNANERNPNIECVTEPLDWNTLTT